MAKKRRRRKAPPFSHAEGELIGRLLHGIALPHTMEPPTSELRDSVERWPAIFRELQPPLTNQDVMGLTVLRLANEFLEQGTLTPERMPLPVLKGLSLAVATDPERMVAAGFLVPVALPSRVETAMLHEIGERVRLRWLAWSEDMLDPQREAATERRVLVRGLAQMYCMRPVEGERAAFNKARKKLHGRIKSRHGGESLADADDLKQDLWLVPRGELANEGLLKLKHNGAFTFAPEAIVRRQRRMRYAPTARRTKFAPNKPVSLDAPVGESQAGALAGFIPAAEPNADLLALEAAREAREAREARLGTLREQCRRRGPAHEAVLADLEEPRASRAVLAEEFGTTVEKIRVAEQWIDAQIRLHGGPGLPSRRERLKKKA